MKRILKKIYLHFAPWGDISNKIVRLYHKMDASWNKGKKFSSRYYCHLIERRYRCRISPGARIKSGLYLPHPDGIVIGEKSIIGKNVTIYQQVTIGQNHKKYPIIGNNVIIYAGAKIIGNVHIGDNSIIGANAVVTKDVPSNSIWGGNPARELKKRNDEEEYI